MLKHWRILCFWALVVAAALWTRWWGASGFPLEGKICESTNPQYNCSSYNVIFYSAWRLAKAVDHWSALIAALATIAIAGFTLTLWQSNERMWKVTRASVIASRRAANAAARQAKLAQDEFTATHRPRILVRGISFDEGGLVPNKRLMVQIAAVNSGETEAFIRDFSARIFLVNSIDNFNVGDDFHKLDVSGRPPIKSGTYFKVGMLTDRALDANEIFGIMQKTLFLVCVGYVQYRDANDSLRTTGFARCLTPIGGRFSIAIKDDEYEFSY
jgi:hypothetical protein